MWKEATGSIPAILLGLLWPDPAQCAPFPSQAHVAARYLQRWLDRLDHRVVNARQSSVISEDQYRSLQERVRAVGVLRDEALGDGVVSVREREAIHRAIGEIDMDLAEAKVERLRAPPPERQVAGHVPRRQVRPPPASSSGSGSAQ